MLFAYSEDPLKHVWDCVIGLLLVYTALVMPFSLAFVEVPRWSAWFIFDLVIDGLFFTDIFVNCCSAYYNNDSQLVTNRKQIFMQYAKS